MPEFSCRLAHDTHKDGENKDVKIAKVTPDVFKDWLDLALRLWPDSSAEDMQITLTHILHSPREAGFVIRDEEGAVLGFMNLALRHDYVPGATQKPVAYVEGIYVKDEYRQQGVATSLIRFAEGWALEQGCAELASDALLENTTSHLFHTKVGFQEVERVVAFIKPITRSR